MRYVHRQHMLQDTRLLLTPACFVYLCRHALQDTRLVADTRMLYALSAHATQHQTLADTRTRHHAVPLPTPCRTPGGCCSQSLLRWQLSSRGARRQHGLLPTNTLRLTWGSATWGAWGSGWQVGVLVWCGAE